MRTEIDASKLANVLRRVREAKLTDTQWEVIDAIRSAYPLRVGRDNCTRSVDGISEEGTSVYIKGVVLIVYSGDSRRKTKQDDFDRYICKVYPDIERHVENTTLPGIGRTYYYVLN